MRDSDEIEPKFLISMKRNAILVHAASGLIVEKKPLNRWGFRG
jgi:hypothetical protein